MKCTLAEFLLAGQLGELKLGVSASMLVELLGPPTWWEGMCKWKYPESEIWRYGRVNIHFNAQKTVETILFDFTVDREEMYASLSLSPWVFTDVNPCSLVEYHTFLSYIQGAAIPSENARDSTQAIVKMPGCIAKFSHFLLEESVQAERPIRTTECYLRRLSIRDSWKRNLRTQLLECFGEFGDHGDINASRRAVSRLRSGLSGS